MPKLVCTLLGCFLSLMGHTQVLDGFFKNYTTEHGLPSDRVLSATQDGRGMMWFGTNDGLSQFDGYEFKTLYHQPNDRRSIASDNIYYLESDAQQILWVGHYEAGLDQLDVRTKQVKVHLNESNGLPDNRITYLWHDHRLGQLWVGSHQHLFCRYDPHSGQILLPKFQKKFSHTEDIPAKNSVYQVLPVVNHRSEYWIATNDGLMRYNVKTTEYEYFRLPHSTIATPQNRLRGIVAEGDSILWIGTRGGGMLRFHTQTCAWQIYQYSQTKGENLIVHIAPKSPHEIWVATWDKSLGIFDTQTRTFRFFGNNPTRPSSILPLTANRLMEDNQHNLWVCMGAGISFLSAQLQYFPVIALPKPNIASSAMIFEPLTFIDDSQNIYIGMSAADGLLIYDKKSRRVRTKRPSGLPPNESLTNIRMAKDSQGKIWIAAYHRLMVYDPKTDKIRLQTLRLGNTDELIHSIAFDTQYMYLGTREHGFYQIDLTSQQYERFEVGQGLGHQRFLHELFFDSLGHLWITTERGLSVFDPQTRRFLKTFTQRDGFKVIYRITEDTQQQVWISTENQGVIGIDARRLVVIKTLTKQNGLPSNAIQHLAADHIGNLWISTQQGLCKYQINQQTIEVFDKQNGLIDNHLQGSLNILSDGTMAQGFKGSFTIFNPKMILKQTSTRSPIITDFHIFDQPQPVLTNKIELNYYQNFFSFRFSNLDYVDASKVIYFYQLVGVDKTWQQLPKNEYTVSYKDLKGGNYLLKLKTNKSPKENTYQIRIIPPFWQTWWFYGLCLAVLLAGVYGIYILKIRQIKREETLKTELNKQLANSEMKALRSQMNPHFLFNSLNSIKYYILQNEPELASKYLNQFSKLIRSILSNSQHDFITLAEEIETLQLYLEMEVLRFGGKVRYTFDLHQTLEPDSIYIPSMILQPYVENAIWHGLMHQPQGGIVAICIQPSGEKYWQINIDDNGIGRIKAAELKSKSATKSKSLGLKITQERIKLLNQHYDLDMQVTILDKTDPQGHAQGTQIQIRFKDTPNF